MKKRRMLISWVWKGLWGLAGLVVLIALAYPVENWRGARAWDRARERLDAAGETLDFEKLSPPAVPDEENFFALPVLEGIAVFPYSSSGTVEHDSPGGRLRDLASSVVAAGFVPRNAFWTGESADLDRLAEEVRKIGELELPEPNRGSAADDLAAGFAAHADVLESLVQGSDRRYARLTPSAYERKGTGWSIGMDPPDILFTRDLGTLITVWSLVALRRNDHETAMKGCSILRRLAEGFLEDGALISGVTGTICLEGWWVVIFEGLKAGVWTEKDMEQIQRQLEKIDLVQSFMRMSRHGFACGIDSIEWVKANRDLEWLSWRRLIEEHDWPEVEEWMPSGMYDQNKATLTDWYLQYLIEPLRGSAGFREYRDAQMRFDVEGSAGYLEPFSRLAKLAAVGILGGDSIGVEMTKLQVICDEAEAACALERYRIRNGHYPERLQSLVPDFMREAPKDIVDGKPMRYRSLEDEDGFVLYSIGTDGNDDGGRVNLLENPPQELNFRSEEYKGDWTWGGAGGFVRGN